MALRAVGYPRPISDLYEGTRAARLALDVYGQTRDELLQASDYTFAYRQADLQAVPGAKPPSPWVYEYAYPADCLRVRYVRPGPLSGGTRSLDPQPQLFTPFNDIALSSHQRVILYDISPAVLIYTGRVVDPTFWEPGFTRTLIDRLTTKFATLAPDAETAKLMVGNAAIDGDEAKGSSDAVAPIEGRTMVRR